MEKGGWVTITANRCRGGSTFGISGTLRGKRRKVAKPRAKHGATMGFGG